MDSFSIRNGYRKTSDMKIRERITPEMKNSLWNSFNDLKFQMSRTKKTNGVMIPDIYEEYIWLNFLNLKKDDYYTERNSSAHVNVTNFILEKDYPWHFVFDFIEVTIHYLEENILEKRIKEWFNNQLNCEFDRLNYGYQIKDDKIIEIK